MFGLLKKVKQLEKRIDNLEEGTKYHKMGEYCHKCKNYMPPDKFNGGHACYYCKLDNYICKDFNKKKNKDFNKKKNTDGY